MEQQSLKEILRANLPQNTSAIQIQQAEIARDFLQENKFDKDSITACLLWPLHSLSKFNFDDYEGKIDHQVISILKAGKMLKDNSEKISLYQKMQEQLKQLVVAATIDFRVIFVQIAFWYAELKLIGNSSQESKQLAEYALNIYSPIAHRFGFYNVKNEIEELAFSILEPEASKEIKDYLSKFGQEQKNIFTSITADFRKHLELDDIKHKLTIRTKSAYSTYFKAKQQNKDFRKLHDLIACRIVTGSTSDCYRVLGVIHQNFTPIDGRFKDYISRPKHNGYKSLHTTVIDDKGTVFEVQIRTEEMHQHAEFGIAAHYSYKEGGSGAQQNISWLREIIENIDLNDQNQALDSLKRELYENAIYVFTPQGKMIKLPSNSSIIDFAYEIHSKIGDNCFGAKVDGKFLPIRTKLENGQIVEVITNNTTAPKSDWLKYCVTNKARQHIRSSIKIQSQDESSKLGEKIILKLLPSYALQLEQFLKSENLQKFLKKKSLNSIIELYSAIGFGTIEAAECLKYVKQNLANKTVTKFLNFTKKAIRHSDLLQGIPTRIAQCCQPLAGDQTIGVISKSGLIKIHRSDCVNLKNLDPSQKIALDWNINNSGSLTLPMIFDFDGGLKILNVITKNINSLKIKMKSSKTETIYNPKVAMRFSVVLEVEDIKFINDLKNRLKKYPINIKQDIGSLESITQ